MQDRLRAWRGRSAFKLPEAALLMTESYPEEYSDERELLQKPPKDFIAVYGQLLIDAVMVENEGVECAEVDGGYYTEYVLNTDKPKNVTKLSYSDGLNVSVDKYELIRYVKAKNIRAIFFTDDSLVKFEPDASEKPLAERERNSLHIIIGALLETYDTKTENEGTHFKFKNQSALIDYLIEKYRDFEGISKPNLTKVFPKAKKLLEQL
jgi:hypothetical protein